MNTYIALDLETTGLNPSSDRIIEIGAIKVENHKIVDTFSTFVDPQMQVPLKIQQLTGITTAMASSGMSGEAAIQELVAFCQDEPLLGHNIMFDFSFVKHKAVNMGLDFERSGLDTLAIARKTLRNLESRRLGALCSYYEIDCTNFHRASDDALATHMLYQKLRGDFEMASPDIFTPQPLIRNVKKQGPITKSQKVYLNDLIKYHKIELDVQIDSLTKNEASRIIDRIILEHGRIKR